MENILVYRWCLIMSEQKWSDLTMDYQDAANQLQKALEIQNRNICQNMLNPGPLILFPSYEDWKNQQRCQYESQDNSLEAYWIERREAERYYYDRDRH